LLGAITAKRHGKSPLPQNNAGQKDRHRPERRPADVLRKRENRCYRPYPAALDRVGVPRRGESPENANGFKAIARHLASFRQTGITPRGRRPNILLLAGRAAAKLAAEPPRDFCSVAL
jgi:hypothetical protein